MFKRIQPTLSAVAVLLIAVAMDPALANKFETIGGGFSGSSGIKREWLQKFFLSAGGLALAFAILAIIIPHRNPLFLNYKNWKQSAVMLFIVSAGFFTASLVI